MRLKSFYGPTMTEAMRLVREALGDDAIIVATRDDEMGGVRVTAAIDEPLSPPQTAAKPVSPSIKEDGGCVSIETIANALVKNMVPATLAEKLIATATQYANDDPLLSLGAAFDMHFKYQPITDETPCPPILLMGPPGAGKTLAIAKLATKAALAKKKIALISTDTKRAGAMAQLGAFARLLKAEMMEIEDSHALQDAVSIQTPDTLVLIDTAGCNPFSNSDRQELSAIVTAAKAQNVLVLPADMEACQACDLAKEYASIGANRLMITRVDLARRVGGLLHFAYESRLPLTCFGSSDKVTETPQPFNPVSLARLVLPKSATAVTQA